VRAGWTKVASAADVAAKGKMVVEVGGAKILLVNDGGALYAVSNKCSHLGLPLVGKTAVFQAEARARASHSSLLCSGDPAACSCARLRLPPSPAAPAAPRALK